MIMLAVPGAEMLRAQKAQLSVRNENVIFLLLIRFSAKREASSRGGHRVENEKH